LGKRGSVKGGKRVVWLGEEKGRDKGGKKREGLGLHVGKRGKG
jgi:hypothetical protein